jgi:hypothetical protein
MERLMLLQAYEMRAVVILLDGVDEAAAGNQLNVSA